MKEITQNIMCIIVTIIFFFH